MVLVGHLTEVAEVGEEEEEGWGLSRPENGWKDRRGVVGRPQAAPTTCPHCPILLLLLLRRRSGLPGRRRERQSRRRRRRGDFPHHLLSSRGLLIRKARVRSRSPVGTWVEPSYTACCARRSSDRCLWERIPAFCPAQCPSTDGTEQILGNEHTAINTHTLNDGHSICHCILKGSRYGL